VTAAQGESGDSGGRNNPCRNSQPECVAGAIHIALCASRLGAHRSGVRLDADPFHWGEVNDQPVVAASETGAVVTTAANGDEKVSVSTEIHRADHIGRIGTPGDQQRTLVDHCVVKFSDFIVPRVIPFDQLTAQARLEFFYILKLAHHASPGLIRNETSSPRVPALILRRCFPDHAARASCTRATENSFVCRSGAYGSSAIDFNCRPAPRVEC
jgi:hypothetical protein